MWTQTQTVAMANRKHEDNPRWKRVLRKTPWFLLQLLQCHNDKEKPNRRKTENSK